MPDFDFMPADISNWLVPLSRPIAPTSGPLREMHNLLDARRAIEEDLPIYLHDTIRWGVVRRALILAAKLNTLDQVERASRLLATAIKNEGWQISQRP